MEDGELIDEDRLNTEPIDTKSRRHDQSDVSMSDFDRPSDEGEARRSYESSPPRKIHRGNRPHSVASQDEFHSSRNARYQSNRGDDSAPVRRRDVEEDRRRRRSVSPSPDRKHESIMETSDRSDSNPQEPSKIKESSALGLREMSIDEMNAMRVSLGLKPLEVDNKPKATNPTQNASEELSTAERLRIAKERRMERSRRQAVKPNFSLGDEESIKPTFTLGDASDEETDSSTASWISRHQKILEEKKLAEMRAKELEETEKQLLKENEENEAANASFLGMKVVHDQSEITEDTILTIKDQSVLEGDGTDELESVQLAALERAQKLKEKKKKKSKYDLYDEEGNSKGVLTKYDEEEKEAEERAKKGFILGGTNQSQKNTNTKKSIISAMDQEEDSMDQDTLTLGKVKKPISLMSSNRETGRDFTTQAEANEYNNEEVSFSKKSGVKKQKKIRKRSTTVLEDEQQQDEATGSGSLLDSLQPVSSDQLGSRLDRSRRLTEEEELLKGERQQKFFKYQSALRQANEKSKSIFGTQNSEIGDQDDASNITNAPLPTRVEDIVARTREMQQRRIKSETEEELPVDTQSSSELVFSNLTDFNIQTNDDEEEEASLYSRIKKEDPSQSALPIPVTRPSETRQHDRGEADMEIDEEERSTALDLKMPVSIKKEFPETASEEMDEDQVDVRERKELLKKSKQKKGLSQEDSSLEARPSEERFDENEDIFESKLPLLEETTENINAHKGLGTTLAMLMQRGGIQDTRIYAGRDRDERAVPAATSTGERDINLEKKDRWGRTLTTKEAYREFCYQYSGKAPGKRKQEKKYQKMKAQIERQKQLTDSGIVAGLSSIQHVQHKSKSAYVVLSSQNVLSTGKEVTDMVLGDQLKSSSSSSSGTASVKPGAASVIKK